MFTVHCAKPGSVEYCDVVNSDGSTVKYPVLKYRKEIIDPEAANRYIGIQLKADDMAANLTRMYLKSTVLPDGKLEVEVPPTRHDILHPVDIYEDIGRLISDKIHTINCLFQSTVVVFSFSNLLRLQQHQTNLTIFNALWTSISIKQTDRTVA